MIKIKKNGQKVWVTFTFLPVETTDVVVVSGEWSKWKEEPMKRKKSGEFYVTKVLKAGNTFEFGYKVNGEEWFVDSECDTVSSPFNTQNSILKI